MGDGNLCVDPGMASLYLWVHLILLFVVATMWLYGYGEPPEEEEDDTPKDYDERGWR